MSAEKIIAALHARDEAIQRNHSLEIAYAEFERLEEKIRFCDEQKTQTKKVLEQVSEQKRALEKAVTTINDEHYRLKSKQEALKGVVANRFQEDIEPLKANLKAAIAEATEVAK